MNPFLTAAIFFQLWMPIWESRPFRPEDFKYENRVRMEEAMQLPIEVTLEVADARLRMELYTILASAPIPANQAFLLDKCLPAERDPMLQAGILSLLAGILPQEIPAARIAPYVKNKSPHVRLEAIRLYGMLPDSDPRVIVEYLGTPETAAAPNTPSAPSLAIQLAAWNCFAQSPRLANTLGSNFLKFKKAEPLELRCLVLKTGLAQQKRKPETTAWLKECLQAPARLRVTAASDPRPADFAIPAKLLRDKETAVRQAVCDAASIPEFAPTIAGALSDKEPAVRFAALKALQRCNAPVPDHLRKIVPLLDDASPIVQEAAEEAFATLASKQDAEEMLGVCLAPGASTSFHRHGANIARILNLHRLLPAIASLLAQEKSPEALAAVLNAVAFLAKKGQYENEVMPFAKHGSCLVRQMAVRAMGRLQYHGQEKEIIRQAADRNPPEVSVEAYEAMGRFPQPAFMPAILDCLKKTTKTLSQERANAAWAAGFIRPTSPQEQKQLGEIVERLRLQCTVPVIPTADGPAFEDTDVIANTLASLVKIAKREGVEEYTSHARYVLSLYDISPEKQAELAQNTSLSGSGPSELPRTPVTWSLAHQMKQWMDGEKIETQPIPSIPLTFPITPLP